MEMPGGSGVLGGQSRQTPRLRPCQLQDTEFPKGEEGGGRVQRREPKKRAAGSLTPIREAADALGPPPLSSRRTGESKRTAG